ncbi:MAG TPA: hypothetical protein VFA68_17630 [Terriglobales bacterium]|nr:hypothetical protein [Terriglobales bacterium]
MSRTANFAILTNRRRALIALAHSIVFLGIAFRGLLLGNSLRPIWLHPANLQSSVAVLAIYVVVTSVLIQLARMSGSARERLYFLFCASSASVGTIRNVVGDPAPHVGLLLRVLMLACAVATGVLILRTHSTSLVHESPS